MSEVYHQSCYTSRSSGYKYGTLSTSTGERKRCDSKEETDFDKKLWELKKVITSRILSEMDATQKARESINSKFEKIDEKIDSMLELQNTVICLRKDLQNAESTLADMFLRVKRLDVLTVNNETRSLHSKKSSFRNRVLILEGKETSTITHI